MIQYLFAGNEPEDHMSDKVNRTELVLTLRAAARAELAANQPVAALGLAMQAFELDADDPETLSFVDGLVSGVSDADSLLAVDADSPSLFRRALRARVMANVGRRIEATRAMIGVIERAPHRPFIAWLASWLDEEACRVIGIEGLKQLILSLAEFATQYSVPPPDVCLPMLRAGATLLSTVRRVYPDERQLYSAEVLIRRRLSDPERTLHVAQLGIERFPDDWGCLNAMATALEDSGRAKDALDYANRARAVDPP